MSTTVHPTRPEGSTPDRQLPGHRFETRHSSRPLRVLGAAAGALGMSVVAALYLIAGPLVGLATGAWQICMEVRENAVRPRPFVGARHGLPFLDPTVAVRSAEPTMDDTEE